MRLLFSVILSVWVQLNLPSIINAKDFNQFYVSFLNTYSLGHQIISV